MTSKAPTGLGAGGRALWRKITDAHALDAAQEVQLTEACRAKDRLDKLDEVLRGDVPVWMSLDVDEVGVPVSLRIDAALAQAIATANVMKQLLSAMRLPDEATGKRPQARGGARGSYGAQVPGGKDATSRAAARWGS